MNQVFIHTDIFFKDTSSPNEVKYIPVIVKDFFCSNCLGTQPALVDYQFG